MDATAVRREPLVSIIIPYYRQPAFIGESVRSASKQRYPNTEIIVVDDGSPEPAEPFVRHIEGVRLLRTHNSGAAAARNIGFHASAGEYLIFLDSDDVLMPGAVRAHLDALRRNPDAGLSFGAIRIIDEVGRELSRAHICRPRRNYFLMLLEGNPIGCPGSVMLRRGAFMEAGLFETSLRNAEDYDLYLKIARRRPLVRHTFCVAEYRRHSGGKSQVKQRQLATTLAVLDGIQSLLTKSERKRLPHARRRWRHAFCQHKTMSHRLWSIYFKFRAVFSVSPQSYFAP
jgi:glycosyltransferase involved in cell wall biosynthesis